MNESGSDKQQRRGSTFGAHDAAFRGAGVGPLIRSGADTSTRQLSASAGIPMPRHGATSRRPVSRRPRDGVRVCPERIDGTRSSASGFGELVSVKRRVATRVSSGRRWWTGEWRPSGGRVVSVKPRNGPSVTERGRSATICSARNRTDVAGDRRATGRRGGGAGRSQTADCRRRPETGLGATPGRRRTTATAWTPQHQSRPPAHSRQPPDSGTAPHRRSLHPKIGYRRWPDFWRLVSRYCTLWGFGSTLSGMRRSISISSSSRPWTFSGLLVISSMESGPMMSIIWAATP